MDSTTEVLKQLKNEIQLLRQQLCVTQAQLEELKVKTIDNRDGLKNAFQYLKSIDINLIMLDAVNDESEDNEW